MIKKGGTPLERMTVELKVSFLVLSKVLQCIEGRECKVLHSKASIV